MTTSVLCFGTYLKHDGNNILTQQQARNWTEIATKCNTTKGAAAKRYSRLKQAFDKGVPPPGITSSSDKTTTKTTKATASVDENIETATPPTPKRKRNPPKKKAAAAEEHNVKPEPEDSNAGSDVGEETKPKRAKANTAAKLKNTKGKAGGKNKNKNLNPPTPTTEATTWIKGEHEEDAFYDAPEGANGLPQDDRENTVDRKSPFLLCFSASLQQFSCVWRSLTP